MARLELVPEVFDDFDRFLDHLDQFDDSDVSLRIEQIVQALQVLTHSPLIGRQVNAGRRVLVIGEGSRGYLALYQFVPDINTVFILAIRSQRESGYKRR